MTAPFFWGGMQPHESLPRFSELHIAYLRRSPSCEANELGCNTYEPHFRLKRTDRPFSTVASRTQRTGTVQFVTSYKDALAVTRSFPLRITASLSGVSAHPLPVQK